MKLFLAIILFSTQSFAICTKPVSYLKEGAKAECTGYLFSPEAELEVRIKVANFDNMEQLVKRTEELNAITETRLNNQLAQNQRLIETVNNQERASFWQNTGYFVLGVLVTGFLATNVGR